MEALTQVAKIENQQWAAHITAMLVYYHIPNTIRRAYSSVKKATVTEIFNFGPKTKGPLFKPQEFGFELRDSHFFILKDFETAPEDKKFELDGDRLANLIKIVSFLET